MKTTEKRVGYGVSLLKAGRLRGTPDEEVAFVHVFRGALKYLLSSSMVTSISCYPFVDYICVLRCLSVMKPLDGDVSAANVGRYSVGSRCQGRPLRFPPRVGEDASGCIVACCCLTRVIEKRSYALFF
jgi:hypothetical protein